MAAAESASSSGIYRPSQRLVALGFGIACHVLFAAAIGAMALSIFRGMRLGFGPFRGTRAIAPNILLLLSFPLSHSWLLSTRGRRLLPALVPAGIGKDLSTTMFAILSSANLAAIFLLWSPSGTVWWEAAGPARAALALAAAGAWALLVKSMSDGQLSLQTGFLGWGAVFRNRAPRYEPFATRGAYRVVRQPIYVSFALILWLSSAWTPDQLSLAALWTGYCVAGAALKERRYLRYFGDAYRQYQSRVPFWIPRPGRRPEPAPATPAGAAPDADVLVAGGGPVGLLLANLLGRQGLRVILVERSRDARRDSMAIGVTPPSMCILAGLGLDRDFERRGVAIDTARVFENRALLGNVDFSRIPAGHRFILSIPQAETESILRDALAKQPSVRILQGVEFAGQRPSAQGIAVALRDVVSGARSEVTASYLVGCDGHRSSVRSSAGIRCPRRPYRPRFLMADFEDDTGLGSEAHLYFSRHGSVESFPLPGRRRRWIVLTGRRDDRARGIAAVVAERARRLAGHDLSRSRVFFESEFRPSRALARRFASGRVLLCGDAAHVMSPIGGQGMNTGFADAAHLAEALAAALANPASSGAAFGGYEATRRQAFRAAARRAATGMWLGTRTGPVLSALRRAFIARVLLRPPIRDRLAPHVAMLTIPGRIPNGAGPLAAGDAAP